MHLHPLVVAIAIAGSPLPGATALVYCILSD